MKKQHENNNHWVLVDASFFFLPQTKGRGRQNNSASSVSKSIQTMRKTGGNKT
jgi:hypothetical protein